MSRTSSTPVVAGVVIIGLIATITLVLGVRGHSAKKVAEEKKAAEQAAARPAGSPAEASITPRGGYVEALIPMGECTTPCEMRIAWPAKVTWGGSANLRIEPPGDNAFELRHEGLEDAEFTLPSSVSSGTFRFLSLDPKKEHFKVHLYRVKLVRE